MKQVYLVGCGDSYHAAVAASLSWRQLAGINCFPLTSLDFARFHIGFLHETGITNESLVVAISVSGQVSRTIEAARLARHAGIPVIAITGNPDSPLGVVADTILESDVQPLPEDNPNVVVPGVRSYVASLTGLMILAISFGEELGHCSASNSADAFRSLLNVSDLLTVSIDRAHPPAQKLARLWHDADHFVFCGAGPNYGTALYNGAKIVEASGDIGIGQDLEEWAHVNYFCRRSNTPTILISSGGRDQDRALEVAIAAEAIGRRLMIVAPAKSEITQFERADMVFDYNETITGWLSPLITFVPGAMLAAYHAQNLGELYFRDFKGGRDFEGGGGISRIRTSNQIDPPQDEL